MRMNQVVFLNILMNRNPQRLIALSTFPPSTMKKILHEDALYELASKHSPLLKKLSLLVSAANSRVKLAKKGYYPDFNVGLTYGDRQGSNPPSVGGDRSNMLSLMVGVKVPLYGARKQSKKIVQRNSELQTQRYALIDEKNMVQAKISSGVIDYNRAKEQVVLFEKGIIPQSRQTVDSMLAGYQVDQVDFLNLVRSQITLLNYELLYWKAFTESKQALSRIETVIGKDTIYE